MKSEFRIKMRRIHLVFTLLDEAIPMYRFLTSLFVTSNKRKPNVRKRAMKLSFCGKNPS